MTRRSIAEYGASEDQLCSLRAPDRAPDRDPDRDDDDDDDEERFVDFRDEDDAAED